MKLTHRAVAVAAVAALTVALPGAAHAGGKPAAKGTKAAQEAKGKAEQARKKAEQARKKAEEARKHFAFPGTVTAADTATATITISRKERGVTVTRSFVLDGASEVKRNGVRATLADVRPGDKAVVVGVRRNGVLVVRKLNVSSTEPAPAASPTPAPAPAIVI